ncbi:hypothetical protein AMECASPLE_011367 [Ameca splendens]|uniref:Uncharacterized protein n=1 Tax=Ameca splendens TaxID=208324 RepID=A0ABV0ZKH3_9TELE
MVVLCSHLPTCSPTKHLLASEIFQRRDISKVQSKVLMNFLNKKSSSTVSSYSFYNYRQATLQKLLETRCFLKFRKLTVFLLFKYTHNRAVIMKMNTKQELVALQNRATN